MTMLMTDYRCKVGVAFFGGCGTNTSRRIVDGLTPDDYPDFSLFVANTDANVQRRHYGSREDSDQKRWADANSLTIHQLGGREVTAGRGAGANPDVGRRAAETEESMEAMRSFFESVDAIILMGGFGGGTGTGALPVAAKLAKKIGKPTLAMVVMPDPDEGRTARATRALAEIQSLVPTIPVRNEYLVEMLNAMRSEERAKLTFEDAWRIVNDNSLVPMLLVIREIIQETGDMTNVDISDWETTLKYGNYVFFGHASVSSPEVEAERVADELLATRFQDPGVISQGEVLILWFHGPWLYEKARAIRKLVKARMTKGDPEREQKIEAHMGIVHRVTDNQMWVGLVVVASELPGASIVRTAECPPIRLVEAAPVAGAGDRLLPYREDFRPVKAALSMISFRSKGVTIEKAASSDLATRFKRIAGNIRATRDDIDQIFQEVEAATGHLPDLPERFLPKPQEKELRGMRSIVGSILIR